MAEKDDLWLFRVHTPITHAKRKKRRGKSRREAGALYIAGGTLQWSGLPGKQIRSCSNNRTCSSCNRQQVYTYRNWEEGSKQTFVHQTAFFVETKTWRKGQKSHRGRCPGVRRGDTGTWHSYMNLKKSCGVSGLN